MKKRHVHLIIFLGVGAVLFLIPLPKPLKDILYKTYNLILFIYIIYAVAAAKVKTFFMQREKRIEKEIAEAHKIKEMAEKLLTQYQEQVDTLERGKAAMLRRFQEEGVRERDRIIREAEEAAQRITNLARTITLQEIKIARDLLKQEIILDSMRIAKESIRKCYSQKDQKKAVDEMLIRLRGVRL